LVVDANIFKGFFESTMGSPHSLSGCPMQLLATCSQSNPIYHDIGKIVEHEWQQVVDRDWFEPWLASQLMSGLISYVEPVRDTELEKKLAGVGFPSGRDIIYARVGLGVVATVGGTCTLFTEDLDFFDPTQKKCPAKTRAKILAKASGPVCKILKKWDVQVSAVP